MKILRRTTPKQFILFSLLLLSIVWALDSAPATTTTKHASLAISARRRPNFVQLPPLMVSEIPRVFQTGEHHHHHAQTVNVGRWRSLHAIDIFVKSESGSRKEDQSFSTKAPSLSTKSSSNKFESATASSSKSTKSAKASKASTPSKGSGGGPSPAPTSHPPLTGKSYRGDEVEQFYENYYRTSSPTFSPSYSMMPSTTSDRVDGKTVYSGEANTNATTLSNSSSFHETNSSESSLSPMEIQNSFGNNSTNFTNDSSTTSTIGGNSSDNTAGIGGNNILLNRKGGDDNDEGVSFLQLAEESLSRTATMASFCISIVIASAAWQL